MSQKISQLYTDWNLSPEIIQKLDTYYLLYWDEKWFREKLAPGLILSHNKKHYIALILPSSLPAGSGRVAISFRKQKGKSYGVALVQFVQRRTAIEPSSGEDHEPSLF